MSYTQFCSQMKVLMHFDNDRLFSNTEKTGATFAETAQLTYLSVPECLLLVASLVFLRKRVTERVTYSIPLIHWVQVTSICYREETRHHRSGWRSGRRTTPSSRMCTTCATTRWQSGSRMWKRWPQTPWPADNSHKVTPGLFQAISRIMADKVYTSAEFKRERDSFHVSTQLLVCKYSRVQRTTIGSGLEIGMINVVIFATMCKYACIAHLTLFSDVKRQTRWGQVTLLSHLIIKSWPLQHISLHSATRGKYLTSCNNCI